MATPTPGDRSPSHRAPALGGAAAPYDAIASQARTLAELLIATRPLWDQRPFRERPAPWEADMPEVAVWLRQLDVVSIDALEGDPCGGPPLPMTLADLRDAAAAASHVPVWPAAAAITGTTSAPMRGVKGRKQAQIAAFQRAVAAPLDRAAPRRLVDWCGGKGHLTRALAARCGCSVCVVDREGALVTAAVVLGAAAGVSVTGHAADVTTATPPVALDADAALVALHACGQLTDAAVRAAIDREVPWLALVPCCHHRVPSGGWRPLSNVVRQTGLQLNVNALRLSIADEGPATPRARARRRQEMCWRIGADLLFATCNEDPTAPPLGVIPRATYGLSYEAFCTLALAGRGLVPPRHWRPDAHLREATDATRVVRALSLVRGLLRRSVETLCVLDRGQALVEAGWRVNVGTFCDPAITPRNLLLIASR